jgi:UDP-N-acetylmuramoyl-L-alanyl-D-glutamate--2,6-diaminopimelate ligase
MKLGYLLDAVSDKKVNNFMDTEITSITSNSRLVNTGALFVAVRGVHTDGHLFVPDAIKRGAAACVTETPLNHVAVTNAIVEDTRKALSLLAARFYGDPARELLMCGVTGTNGKTSTAYLLRSICSSSSWGKVGIVGTIGYGVGTSLEPALNTTPDAVKLHKLFREMKDLGCRGVVMEVSSHAVRQQRTWGIEFEIGILTNVTRDHLDYHRTLEDYISAKREFCMSLAKAGRKKGRGKLVYSMDDAIARNLGNDFPGESVSVGLSDEADVFATDVEAHLTGTWFTMHLGPGTSVPVHLRLLGRFNVYNALLAAAAARLAGIKADAIKMGLEALEGVPGRFEAIGGKGRPLVVIDYSHTPDSLERFLNSCLDLKPDRLITVFGCGGDRDKGKRPLMGKIVQDLSDTYYVTSDNPRSENPEEIIEDILSGMDRSASGLFVEIDRRKAIQEAIHGAGTKDMVAVCGKGHEDYQIIGDRKIHFKDREEAEKALEEWDGE